MISQTAEYALRAVVALADAPGNAMTTHDIAARTRVPPRYLCKVLQALGRMGIVHSQRGLHGGFTLARPAAEITILEIVNAVDPLKRITHCPLGLVGHTDRLCPLHQRLDEATAIVERSFGDCTVADVLGSTDGPPPLCDVAARERPIALGIPPRGGS